MQETAELKERFEKDRVELESRLRLQIDQQQQRASDLDNQVHNVILTYEKFDFVKLSRILHSRYSIRNEEREAKKFGYVWKCRFDLYWTPSTRLITRLQS